MSCHAFLAYLPPIRPTDLSEVHHLLQDLDVDARLTPFSTSLAVENASAVIVVMPVAQSLNLFWWDPHCVTQLTDKFDGKRLYDTLADGCLDFFTWPCERTELTTRIRRLMGYGFAAEQEDKPLIPDEELARLGLVGHSECFRNALRLIARFASYDVPVLLEGETGTGKELFARALHYLGPRRSRPFVPVNCGALPDTLVENELFGHVAGAYTGARGQMGGVVAQAEGGTLFFDEVHCLSPKGQATLLRFAQDQQYRPLGAAAQRQADVRIVAATNKSLCRCVEDGSFREDLFYRLNVGCVRLPPLRQRNEDISLVVDNVVGRLIERYGTGPRRFGAVSLAWMSTQAWPGNVRELENFVHREFLLSDDTVIRIDSRRSDIPPDEVTTGASFKQARTNALGDFESRYVRTMLSLTGGNVSEAARRAGKDRRVFGRLMKKYCINRDEFARRHS